MNKKRMMAIAIMLWYICGPFMASSFAQNQSEGEQNRLAIEVTVNAGKTFYLPVSALTDGYIVFALVPVDGNTAIKLIPVAEDGRVKLEASLVFEDLQRVRTCHERFILPGEFLGTYFAAKGETNTISRREITAVFKVVDRRRDIPRDAKNTAVTNKANGFVSAITSQEVSGGCPCAECPAGDTTLKCCPNPDRCLTCGDCDFVCCEKLTRPKRT